MDDDLMNAALRHIRKKDKVMSALIRKHGPIITRTSRLPHYHGLVRAIINQQLSVKAGRTIEKRLRQAQGGRHFNAGKILELKPSTMRDCGLSGNKVSYIRTLAEAINTGELNFRKLNNQEDHDVRDTLIQYPGIGQWSADIFLMTSMQRTDIFPIGDLVLRRSMQQHHRLDQDEKHEHYLTIASN
jgi:DNA-3-methyladenine glycosylase II